MRVQKPAVEHIEVQRRTPGPMLHITTLPQAQASGVRTSCDLQYSVYTVYTQQQSVTRLAATSAAYCCLQGPKPRDA